MNKIIPINRLNKFFSATDYDLEVSMGRESVEGDGAFKVVLFEVDRNMTTTDIYNEASKDGVVYKTPVELLVVPMFGEPDNMAFNKSAGTLRDLQDGSFVFIVYQSQLDDLGVNISYGDYIGYQTSETEMRYFNVSNDGSKFYDNKHTIMGYKGAFRTVTCSPVDYNEFMG